jgi:DNA-binding beta-propeller fold protein YncE
MLRIACLAAAMAGALASPAAAQEKGGVDLFGPYQAVAGWLKTVAEGWILHPQAIFAESPDRVFIATEGVTRKADAPPTLTIFDPRLPGARQDHHVVVVNRNGEVIERWTQWYDRLRRPHKVTTNPYDPDKHIWIVDRGSHQVLKFTNDGSRLVLALGERGVPGDDDGHFNQPTDIAWFPDGTFFVSDGDMGTRVVKFDRDGRFLQAFGEKGAGPGQLGRVHSVAVDARRRVYAVDRGAERIEIFDEHGRFLDEWPNFISPSRVWVTEDQSVWVLDAGANRLAKYDLNGRMLTSFGTHGTFPGGFATPHDLSVDSEGSLYLSNGFNHTFDKYVPRKDADPKRLVGRRLGDGDPK